MSRFLVALDADNEPTIWVHHLYSDDEPVIRRSLWLALVRGYHCDVKP